MKNIKWPNGTDTQKLLKFTEYYGDLIRHGRILAVDPSSKSAGWALYDTGMLQDAGEIKSSGDVHERLRHSLECLSEIAQDIDILAIEKIRGRNSHAYLFWAVGVAIAAVKPLHFIEVPPRHWKALCDPEYLKTDRGDATLIGQVLIQMAKT